MNINIIDPGFNRYITQKYGYSRQKRLRFPALIFLFTALPQIPVLKYFVSKNMNLLTGKSNYNIHQHRHLHFFFNLYPRISPPAPTPIPAAYRIGLSYLAATDFYMEHKPPAHQPMARKQPLIFDNSSQHLHYNHLHNLLHNPWKPRVDNVYIQTYETLLHTRLLEKSTAADFYPIHTAQRLLVNPVPEPAYPINPISKFARQDNAGEKTTTQTSQNKTTLLIKNFGSQRLGIPQWMFPSIKNPADDFKTHQWDGLAAKAWTAGTNRAHTDLHYFNPLKKVEKDLEKLAAVTGSKAVKDLENVMDLKKSPAPDGEFPGRYHHDTHSTVQKPGIDVERLTDQVYRVLERKLRIEKERRGW